MVQTDLVRAIIRCEAKYPVHKWVVNNMHVWPLVRMNMYINALAAVASESSTVKHPRLRRGSAEALSEMVSTLRMRISDGGLNGDPGAPCDFVFLSSAVHRVLIEGKYRHRFFTPLAQALSNLDRKGSLWETACNRGYLFPRDLPAVAVSPRIRYLQVLSTLRKTDGLVAALDGYTDLVAHAQREGLRSTYFNVEILKRETILLRSVANLYKRWLGKAGTRVGVVNGNDKYSGAFALACRELGILSVELQHGVQTDLHLAYGSWTNIPPGGFGLRPHVFWCWDTLSAQPIRRWSGGVSGTDGAIVGGNPSLVAPWRISDQSRVRREIQRLISQHGERPLLLVTLSSEGPLVPFECLEAIKLLRDEFVIAFRLHPVNQAQRARELSALLDSGLDVDSIPFESCTDFPLQDWLDSSACVLDARWSTVIHEAAVAGVRSVASCPESADFFPEHVRSGFLRVHQDPSAIAEAVRQQARLRTESSEAIPPPLTETIQSLFEISESLRTKKAKETATASCHQAMAANEK